jgi:hypothetical protein
MYDRLYVVFLGKLFGNIVKKRLSFRASVRQGYFRTLNSADLLFYNWKIIPVLLINLRDSHVANGLFACMQRLFYICGFWKYNCGLMG